MFKKWFLFFLVGIVPQCMANNEATFYYLKAGSEFLSEDKIFLPALGLGARFQKEHFGIDLSASLASLAVINQIRGKCIGLCYPFPQQKHPFYCGMGPGVHYYYNAILLGQPYGGTSRSGSFATFEGLLGVEFRHARFFKTCMQLELSQPVFSISGTFRRFMPNAALFFGIGF